MCPSTSAAFPQLDGGIEKVRKALMTAVRLEASSGEAID
jgi:hypothetical protein